VGIPNVNSEQAKMLERKPLVVIIYTLVAVIVVLYGRDIYKDNKNDSRIDAKDAIIQAQNKEITTTYKEVNTSYKELNDLISSNKYYESKYSHKRNDDVDSSAHR